MLRAVCHHEHDGLVGDPYELGEPLRVEPHNVGHRRRAERLGALGLRGAQAENARGRLPERELVFDHGVRG